MPFSWTQDISVGASIDSADIVEIRQNVDIVDNEKCSSHQAGVDSSYNTTYYSDEHTGYYTSHQAGVDSSYNATYYSGQRSTYQSTHRTGVDSSYNATYYSDQHTGYYTSQNSTVKSSYYSSHRGDYFSTGII